MIFTPSTTVYLCGVPLESDLKNQITFDSLAAQSAYFLSKVKRTYNNFTYQRKDNILRVPANFEVLYNCNYVMYQNSNFGSKWFYAFIVEREYINPNCTHLKLTTDPFQTYMFDVTYYNSFVVREHVEHDTVGRHTLAEPFTNMEYVANMPESGTGLIFSDLYSAENETDFSQNFYAAFFSTEKLFTEQQATNDSFIGGNACPLYITAPLGLQNLDKFVAKLIQNNKLDSVIAVAPISIYHTNRTIENIPDIGDIAIINDSLSKWTSYIYPWRLNPTAPFDTLNGYTPRNKKLYTYPYCYGLLQSTDGQSFTIKYEDLKSNDFQCIYSATPNPSITVLPKNYKWDRIGANNAISFSNFPAIPFKYDTFSAWYAANKNSTDFSMFRKFVGFGSQIVRENIGGVINSALDIGQTIAKFEDMRAKPDDLRGAVSGNAQLYAGKAGIYGYEMCVKYEYARIIDDYFTMYGYAVNDMKNPHDSFNTRPNWNYIETREINIAGDLPDDDLNTLKAMFNSGVTLWHNPATFGDYSQNNAPT